MTNPWLQIPASEYDGHMTGVGQAQALSKITGLYLEKYKPARFALLGCATGNGLEHVKPVTKHVYAVDINPEYLRITQERFGKRIEKLKTCLADIQKQPLPFSHVNLIIAALIHEYTNPDMTLPVMTAALSAQL